MCRHNLTGYISPTVIANHFFTWSVRRVLLKYNGFNEHRSFRKMNHDKNIIRFFSNANAKSKKTGKKMWRAGQGTANPRSKNRCGNRAGFYVRIFTEWYGIERRMGGIMRADKSAPPYTSVFILFPLLPIPASKDCLVPFHIHYPQFEIHPSLMQRGPRFLQERQ